MNTQVESNWAAFERMQREHVEATSRYAAQQAEHQAKQIHLQAVIDLYLAEQTAHMYSMLNGICDTPKR